MEIIRYILIVVEVLSCILLIGVILLQQSKSQGMGVAFGGGMSETLFGSRAGNILTKLTVILALIFLANTTLLGIMYTSREEASLVEQAAPTSAGRLPVTPSPGGPDLMTATPEPMPPSVSTIPMPVVEDVPAAGAIDAPAPEPVILPAPGDPAPEEANPASEAAESVQP